MKMCQMLAYTRFIAVMLKDRILMKKISENKLFGDFIQNFRFGDIFFKFGKNMQFLIGNTVKLRCQTYRTQKVIQEAPVC